MKNLMGTLVLAVLSLTGSISLAFPIPAVSASVYQNNCGYYSNTSGILKFQYRESDPNDRAVGLVSASVIYGLIGNDGTVEWPERIEIPLKHVSRGFWEAEEKITFHSRGSSVFFNKVGFVIHLVYYNGEVYDNGGTSVWGSYEVDPHVISAPCVTRESDTMNLPPFQILPVTVRNKN